MTTLFVICWIILYLAVGYLPALLTVSMLVKMEPPKSDYDEQSIVIFSVLLLLFWVMAIPVFWIGIGFVYIWNHFSVYEFLKKVFLRKSSNKISKEDFL